MSVAGLTMTGQPAAIAGADLVHDQVERMVEGADRDHDADRLVLVKAIRPAEAALTPIGTTWPASERRSSAQLQHAVDGARHLDPGIDQRLAAFARRLDAPDPRPARSISRAVSRRISIRRGRRQPAVAVPEQAVGGGERALDRLARR